MTKRVETAAAAAAAALNTTKSRQSNISFEKHSLFILEQLEELIEASSEDELIVNEHNVNNSKKKNISTDTSIASSRLDTSIRFNLSSERSLTGTIEYQDSDLSSSIDLTLADATPFAENDEGFERSKTSSSVTMHSSFSSSSSSVLGRIQDGIIAKSIADGKIASAPASMELVLGSDGSWSTCSSRHITFKRC